MKKILVVDDDIVMLRLIQLQVKRSGCNGYFFSDAKSAIEALPNVKPDLVVLDYNMPGATGAELYQAMQSHENTAGVPVVFVTGAADNPTLKEIKALNPLEILSKPFSPRRLQTLIEEMMQG